MENENEKETSNERMSQPNFNINLSNNAKMSPKKVTLNNNSNSNSNNKTTEEEQEEVKYLRAQNEYLKKKRNLLEEKLQKTFSHKKRKFYTTPNLDFAPPIDTQTLLVPPSSSQQVRSHQFGSENENSVKFQSNTKKNFPSPPSLSFKVDYVDGLCSSLISRLLTLDNACVLSDRACSLQNTSVSHFCFHFVAQKFHLIDPHHFDHLSSHCKHLFLQFLSFHDQYRSLYSLLSSGIHGFNSPQHQHSSSSSPSIDAPKKDN